MARWEADTFEGDVRAPRAEGGARGLGTSAAGSAKAPGTAGGTSAAGSAKALGTAGGASAAGSAKALGTAGGASAVSGASASSASVVRELTATAGDEEGVVERSLRPQYLQDYLGQSRVKDNLSVLIEATRARGEALDHLLLSGPPGLGKTTMAGVVANELGVSLKVSSGPAIERAGDLAAILTNLERGDVLFIDEIHRLNRAVEEVLYPAMEDFVLDIVIGKGPAARSLRLDLVPFTLIGATTRTGLLTGPLRDRFGIAYRLDYYTPEELLLIVRRSATLLEVGIDDKGALEIARRSRGTPRLANRLLRRVRDFAEVRAGGRITLPVAREALSFFEVDSLGLDNMDNKILDVLTLTFAGAPVGLTTLASALGEDPESVEEVYEPYLLQQGLIRRTPKGRVATARAFEHRGLPATTASSTAQQQMEGL